MIRHSFRNWPPDVDQSILKKNSNELNTICRYTSNPILFASCNKINCKFQSGLLLMSKLHSKVSPSFPAATDPLPNHKYEGVELVLQEAKKDERAVSTLHNTQTNHIKSIHMYIFASIKIEK